MNANPSFSGCCSSLYEMPLTTLLLGDSFHPGGTKLTQRLAEKVWVGPNDQVLDVACGSGISAHVLALEYGAEVFGIDRSASLIARAKESWTSPDYRFTPNFSQADVAQLPFQTDSLDVVFCECALCTFSDPMLALSEFLRVLKPGGRLAISDITIEKPVPESLQTILAHNICVAGAHSEAKYEAMIAEAGFTSIRVQETNQVLFDMIERIERRLNLGEIVSELQKLELPEETLGAGDTLNEAREFLSSGGAGYALFSARK